MKKINQDSASALSRFSRDKRTRTSAAESAEHTPRPRREADNEGRQGRGRQSAEGRGRQSTEGRGRQTSQGRPASNGRRTNETRRASFNPNFTSDNRPAFREEGSFSEEKPRYGARTERGQRGTSTRSNGGSKPFGSKERKFGSTEKTFGAKSGFKSDSRSRGKRGSNEERTHSYPKYSSKQFGAVRLNKFLAQSGLCSRREADDFITAGLVTVNGVIVTELGTKVMPSDEVKFNDSKVQGEKKVYLVLNKPKGYVTSLEDPHADKTVMELVKNACTERIYPVGRLDKNSLGLLLFTNDGDVTRQLTHPSHEKKKIYQVTLDKPLTKADMEKMTEGIELEDGEIYADEVAYVGDTKKEIGIEIHSGRNRIVRRIFEHLGYTVQKLDRVYYAGITKKNLKRGAWRFLTNEEVDRLKSGRYE